MFDVRFHLGGGKHYKHWQIKTVVRDVFGSLRPIYFDPAECSLILHDCLLKNNRNKAEKIFESKRRDVCGFVRCSDYEVVDKHITDAMFVENTIRYELMFDPKIAPYWRKQNDPDAYDNMTYHCLVTNGKKIFVPT